MSKNSALCFRHSALRETRSSDADLSSAFNQLGAFRSAIANNDFLSKLLALLVQNRVSTSRPGPHAEPVAKAKEVANAEENAFSLCKLRT